MGKWLTFAKDLWRHEVTRRGPFGMGWIPDERGARADRDYRLAGNEVLDPRHGEFVGLVEDAALENPPPSANILQPDDCVIRDQGRIGSCTAFAMLYAADAVVFLRQGEHRFFSPRYTYYWTRRMAGYKGDSGAQIRDTIWTTATAGTVYDDPRFGWPYGDSILPTSPLYYDKEPPKRVEKTAENKAGVYWRLDPPGATRKGTLKRIKQSLAMDHPVIGGWYLLDYGDAGGHFAPPKTGREKIIGGHALTLFGYDDDYEANGVKGWFWGPNSWGTGWGQKGRFRISYQHVLSAEHSADFWVLGDFFWVEPVVRANPEFRLSCKSKDWLQAGGRALERFLDSPE